jgi:hypothetical protein
MPPVRFVPGPDQGDAETVVLGVELHDELVIIDIATTKIDAIRYPTPRRGLPAVRVEDDLGNSYSGLPLSRYGAGWSDRSPVARFPLELRPAIPAEARFLRIAFGGLYAERHTVIVML